MKQYSTFHFSGYSWNHHAGKISLKYALDHDIHFEETILLPEPVSDERLKEKEWEIEHALKALFLIGGISYYKTCLPKTIDLASTHLSKYEANFWETVYTHGLGEFFYKNNIDFRGRIHFPSHNLKIGLEEENRLKQGAKIQKPAEQQRVLVPIGGGKDSIVTIELLKKTGAQLTLLRMNAHPIIEELSHVSGLPMITVKRQLSPALFDLNAQGALNGHVPITAYLSILSVLIAILYDFDAVALSNEKSASIGNVAFKGMEINHQWSKSLEFERMLRRIVTEVIGSDVQYFSALRPFSELRITEIFSKSPQYFDHVTSCNKNWKILAESPLHPIGGGAGGGGALWCCSCPKCAFVFACLAAYLPAKKITTMFGKNLFDDAALIPLYKELLGIQKFKPFECVGTPEETAAAFLLARKRGDCKDSTIMKMFEADVLPAIKDPEGLIKESLALGHQHFIPKEFQSVILTAGQ